MNLFAAKTGVSTMFNATKLYLKDHAPQILIGVAIGSELGAIGTSCYAMTKMDGIMDEHKALMADIKNQLEEEKITSGEYQEEVTKIYFSTGVKCAKYWALPVALTGLSITSGLAAYNKINKKYLGAMSSLVLMSEKFNLYRDNVREDVGEERDKIYLDNGIIRAKLKRLQNNNLNDGVEEKYTDKEINEAMNVDNPEKMFKENAERGPFRSTASPYEFEWSIDTVDPNYFNDKSHLYNVQFLHNHKQTWANLMLTQCGILTLNRVLDEIGLGIYMSEEFDDIGWCLKEYDDRCDGIVDFGFDINKYKNAERDMWLDTSPEREHLFRNNPDFDRVMLRMNCCDIRHAKHVMYGKFFGKGGKLEAMYNEQFN